MPDLHAWQKRNALSETNKRLHRSSSILRISDSRPLDCPWLRQSPQPNASVAARFDRG
jgi:hypothetical protein